MLALQKILICLDLTEMDEFLIGYTSYLSSLIKPSRIYFMHVATPFDLFPQERQQVWQTDEPIDEFMISLMEKKIKDHFVNYQQYNISCFAAEGNPHEQTLRWARIKNVDLIVAGRKSILKSSGMVPQKLALTAPCSLLLVPENATTQMDNIWVSCDFSDDSRWALEQAIELARTVPFSTVYCQHIFETGFFQHESLLQEKRQQAEKNYEQFIRQIDLKDVSITPVFTPGNEEEAAVIAYQTAMGIETDVMIAGKKNRNFIENLVSKSFTKKLVETDNSIPLFILKKKLF